jgi:hypothetical protein
LSWDLVYSLVMSRGSLRKGASDWRITFHTWLNWLNWLTVIEPNWACKAL